MTNTELAKTFAKNRVQLRIALKQQRIQMNESIKKEDKNKSNLNIRLYMILYVAWLETSLQYIIYHHADQINDNLRTEIKKQRSQIGMWDSLIKAKFQEYYLNNKKKEFNIRNLGHTNYSRFNYLTNLLKTEIASYIEIRNKFVHGQWAIALNNDGTNKVQETTSKIWTLTKKDTLIEKNILQRFVTLIDALTASKMLFEEKFDKQIKKLEQSIHQFETDYDWIIEEMQGKNKFLIKD